VEHNRQRGLAAVVPGTVRRRPTVTAVLTAPGWGGVMLALQLRMLPNDMRLKVTR